ncbi:acyl-CoA dehydrogenase [Collimonas sp. OK607]|uniref:acyl-CoA dehydrogenase family protein n=1 Tax=Collimonas sp. OK607 TaxID=1798194 RepID=UPI0008EAD6A1|nr:acyl-CoA dehydrogenase family protein [Collimonas sp. OK607]SFA82800.1 acyl-CoA dehydrogenase [Collimonas sp. OK607]
MNFDFSDDQNMLRDEVRKFLINESPLIEARQVMEQEQLYSQPVWRGLTGLGVTSLMLPVSCGGHGLGALELCVVAEEIGRQLAPVPLASTLYLALQALLLGASEAQQQRWLPRIADGAIATLAAPLDAAQGMVLPRFDGRALHGLAPLVSDGEAAAFAVVLAQDEAHRPLLVVADLDASVARRRLATLDKSRPFAELRFEATPAEALDACTDAIAVLAQVRNRAAILLAFEQLGGADAALEMACGYARERKAFGRAIGSYQGIKHKLADIYTGNQMARSHCYYGAWALLSDAPELPLAAAGARTSASAAFSYAAQENIQTHGGMGYTWELDCHMFYRRARQLAVMLGSSHVWREQLVQNLERQLVA